MSEVVLPMLRAVAIRSTMLGCVPRHAYLGRIEYKKLMEEIREYQRYLKPYFNETGDTTIEGLTIHEVKEESYMGVGN